MVVRVDYISSCVANNILGFHLSSAAEFGQNDLDYNGERVTSKRKRRRLSRQSSCLFHFTSPITIPFYSDYCCLSCLFTCKKKIDCHGYIYKRSCKS